MVVAITGSSGFLGRAIVADLGARGIAVRALNRHGAHVAGAAEVVACGNLLEADLDHLLDGCSVVINCAARVHVLRREDPGYAQQLFDSANRDFALRLASAAQRRNLHRFVQISSVAALCSTSPPGRRIADGETPRPTTPYGVSKLLADIALEEMNNESLQVVSLRPPAVIGVGAQAWIAILMRAARHGIPLPIAQIYNQRSFASLSNVASAVSAAAIGRPTGTFIITDSEPMSTADFYRKLLVCAGRGDRVWNWPASIVRKSASLLLRSRADSLLGDAAFDGSRFANAFSWQSSVELDAEIHAAMEGAR